LEFCKASSRILWIAVRSTRSSAAIGITAKATKEARIWWQRVFVIDSYWSPYYNFGSVQITISKENYLKAIAEAESEGDTVIAATLARWLEVSAPAVTMAIRRLKRDGL